MSRSFHDLELSLGHLDAIDFWNRRVGRYLMLVVSVYSVPVISYRHVISL